MKRLLLIIAALVACSDPALAQDFNTTFTLNSANQTGPAVGPLRDVRSQGFISYALSWSTNGTVSAGNCALLGSADNVTFGTTIIAAQAVTSSGSTILTSANTNFIEVSCTTPITGTGNVQMRVMAWRPTNASITTGAISGNSAASATGAAVPANGSYTAVNVGGTLTGVTGTGTSMNVNVTGGTSTGVAQGSTTSGQTVTPAGCATTTSAPTNTTAQTNMLSCDTSGNLRTVSGGLAQGSTTSGQTGTLTQGAVTSVTPTYTTAQTNPLSLETTGHLRVDDKSNVAQGSTTSGETGPLIQAAVTTSSPSYTTAQTSPLSVDTSGSLRVAIISGAGSGGTALADGGTFTASTTSATPISGFYESSPTTCTSGKACAVGLTTNREAKTVVNNLAADAAIGATLTSNPVPSGCHYETSPTTITNATGGVVECDATQHLIVVGTGTLATQAAITAASGSIASGAVASGAFASGSIASGSIASGAVASGAIASGAFAAGSLSSAIPDPCVTGTKAFFPVNIATGTTTVIHAAVSSNNFYICSINLVAAAAQTISVIDGTGGTCGSGTPTGLTGGATAATGWSFAANGGITLGNGLGTVAKTSGTNRDMCLITGQSAQISGTVVYVTAP